MPIKWLAQKEMQNLGRLHEPERCSRKMKAQGDEQCNLRNFATYEIPQVAKILQPGNFQAKKKLLFQPTATPAKTKKF